MTTHSLETAAEKLTTCTHARAIELAETWCPGCGAFQRTADSEQGYGEAGTWCVPGYVRLVSDAVERRLRCEGIEGPRFVLVQMGTFADGKGSASLQVFERHPGGYYVVSQSIGENFPVHYLEGVKRLESAEGGEKAEREAPIQPGDLTGVGRFKP